MLIAVSVFLEQGYIFIFFMLFHSSHCLICIMFVPLLEYLIVKENCLVTSTEIEGWKGMLIDKNKQVL